MTVESYQIPMQSLKKVSDHPTLSKVELGQRLAGAIRYQTISYEEKPTNVTVFKDLHNYLESLFPTVYSKLTVHKLGEEDLSLLFEWPGTLAGSSSDRPVLLTSHLDVVPVPEDTLEYWSVDPFAGIVDEFIWGRGTIDDKQGVLAILEVAEWLLKEGFKPKNSIYLGFGHDEEISGYKGAQFIAQWFRDNNIRIDYLVDEGMTIFKDSPLPLEDTAFIGLAEKGSVVVDLIVKHKGGHASLSTKETAVDILSRAVTKIYDNPMPTRFDPSSPFYKALAVIGPEMNNIIAKAVFSNLWLFDSILSRVFMLDSLTLVNLRTTAAATIIDAGTKSNVLPTYAKATINHRIIPGDTVDDVIQHDIRVINDPRVSVEKRSDYLEASPVSSETSIGYSTIAKSTREAFPGITVAPSLFVANTDTRHYWDIANDIYRFCPTVMTPSDLPRFHGIDERISVDNYYKIIQFYYQLMKNHGE